MRAGQLFPCARAQNFFARGTTFSLRAARDPSPKLGGGFRWGLYTCDLEEEDMELDFYLPEIQVADDEDIYNDIDIFLAEL